MEDHYLGETELPAVKGRTASWAWLWAVILMLLLSLLAPFGVWLLLTSAEPDNTPGATVPSTRPNGGSNDPTTDALGPGDVPSPDGHTALPPTPDPAAELLRLQQQEMKLFFWKRLDQQLIEAKRQLEHARGQIAEWTQAVYALQDSDDGTRLAADTELLRQYEAIVASPDVDGAEVDLVDEHLVTLGSSIDFALKHENLASEPIEGYKAQLEQLHAQALRWSERYRQQNEDLESLLRRAPTDVPEDSVTLSDALVQLRDSRRQADLERMARDLADSRARRADELRQATDETEKTLHDANVDSVRRVGKAKAEAIKAETNTVVEDVQKRIAGQLAAAAAARLRSEYQRDLPAIKRQLAPFVTPGFSQPSGYRSNRTVQFTKTTEKRPASLSFLKGVRALEPTEEGIRRLGVIGSYRFGGEGRPLWPEVGGVVNHQLVVAAQKYLVKYGQLLVDDELLAP